MRKLSARPVFFVRDTPRAMKYYTDTLGFSLDWTHEEEGQPFVVQVSLLGLEIILNQVESGTQNRPGSGRIFVSIDDDQSAALLQHVKSRRITLSYAHWGAPTIAICDLDGNELFIWAAESEHADWVKAGWVPPSSAGALP